MRSYFISAATSIMFCMVFTLPTAAQATKSASSPDKKTSRHLTAGEVNQKYKEVFKTLSDDQQKYLESLKKEQAKVIDPLHAIEKNINTLEGCSALDPSWNSKLSPLVRKSRFMQLDEYEKRHRQFRKLKSKADFIDPYLLNANLQISANIQKQLMKGMFDILKKTIISKQKVEICAELEQELIKETVDIKIISSEHPIRLRTIRDNLTGAITSCRMSFTKTLDNRNYISFSNNFRPKNGRTVFDFSAKIFSPQGKALPIEDLWLDFGNVNTRTVAKLTKPGEELRIGTMPSSYIINFLESLSQSNMVLGIRSARWPETKLIEMPKTEAEELANFANCAAAVEPDLVEVLQKSGFDIMPDDRHEKGAKTAAANNKLRYKTSTLPNDSGTIGGCIWTMSFDAIGKKDFAAVFIIPGVRDNKISAFWVLGTDNGARMNLETVQLSTKEPNTGKGISSDDFQITNIPGQRYEVIMPYDAHSTWVDAISQNGIRVKAKAVGSNDILEFRLPPPKKVATKHYKDCISKIALSE